MISHYEETGKLLENKKEVESSRSVLFVALF